MVVGVCDCPWAKIGQNFSKYAKLGQKTGENCLPALKSRRVVAIFKVSNFFTSA